MTSSELFWKKYFRSALPDWNQREFDLMFRALWEDYLQPNLTKNRVDEKEIKTIIDRLKNQEPVAYLTQNSVFYGLHFMVNNAVLIPRPETEELVQEILNTLAPNTKFRGLDIGTGSGCIAITLIKKCPKWMLEGLDVSESALKIAEFNAERHQTKIKWEKINFLDEKGWEKLGTYDFIVSNPPYIDRAESELMDFKVKRFEPEEALFAPAENALEFYEKISRFCPRHLFPGGHLFLEINEFRARETELIFKGMFQQVEVIHDMQRKPRILKAINYQG